MRRITRHVVVFCLAAALVILPMVSCYAGTSDMKAAGNENSPTTGAMAVDLVLARPLGIASTALGCVGFIASLPFSLLGGNTKVVWDTVVVKPAAFTFKRGLGEFD